MTSPKPTLARLHLVLMHWPILDRTGQRVTTAVTNLDVHDIARLAATYEVGGYWIYQPLAGQRAIVERILHHWTEGPGARLHPARPQALAKVRVVGDLAEIPAVLGPVRWTATTARPPRPPTPIAAFARELAVPEGPAELLLFGTGWGLAPEVFAGADRVLEPIRIGTYPHLSVRSAVAIYLDRIWRALHEGVG